ncbi:Flp pilus assembly protein CpaB [Paenibacillus glycanilyticus]|uniref:SAF domain-containing protein n=1 Tax=Paenibacillus glycanilyticus TaxID=126569 RepID=A0ABQ6GDZ1_9BACL|nr:SAF domain-containing protein [Paenibacillus glycanilyticus]GLX68715.1 hypothetical protein MU1_30600 [Paenibacillus glycanilyticus]
MFDTRRRAFLFLIFSIGLGLAATIMFSSYMNKKETSLGEMVSIYVASKEIPAGQLITKDMLSMTDIPRKFATDSYVQTAADLNGKVSMVPIPEKGIITKPMLRNNNLVNGEYRQVVLRAPFAVFDDQIDVLDKVDLVASYEQKDPKAAKGTEERRTQVLLKNVSVNNVSKKDNEIVSIGVALPLSEAKDLIWMLNYGKEIRVLKSSNAKVASEGE